MSLPLSNAEKLDLDAFLDLSRQRVEEALTRQLDSIDSSQRLVEAMRYATLNGGKRLRPVFVYAAAEAVGAPLANADLPACAVELIHCYSLSHDDLPAMDDDDLRRGKPSLHKAYDEATAILVGDALQCLAFEMLSGASADGFTSNQLMMMRVLAEAAGAQGMVGGQAVDLQAAGNLISIEELESMHRKKTGALISASVLLGAYCATDVTGSSLSALQEYADCIGLAFQIQDDVLDEVADTEVLGKPQGSDKLNNKPTYVSLLGLDGARSKALELAERAQDSLAILPGADNLRNLAGHIVSRIY